MPELGMIAITGVGIVLLAMLWRSRRSARSRKGTASVGAFGWALLFLSSGRMPPPPPQSQIEEETREKKNRESSRSHSS
jgi:hypothetical protein